MDGYSENFECLIHRRSLGWGVGSSKRPTWAFFLHKYQTMSEGSVPPQSPCKTQPNPSEARGTVTALTGTKIMVLFSYYIYSIIYLKYTSTWQAHDSCRILRERMSWLESISHFVVKVWFHSARFRVRVYGVGRIRLGTGGEKTA